MVREGVMWLGATVWLSTIGAGLWLWERHDTTPGEARAPALAPDDVAPRRWQLTVFIHPRCPCSRATFVELSELAREVPDLAVRVLFVLPSGANSDWTRGESWDAAKRVPGADVSSDAGGSQAERFGAETSGHAVLTAPDGTAVFRGGLTPARGRAGDSAGRRAVLGWVRDGTGAPAAPVFGCELFAHGA